MTHSHRAKIDPVALAYIKSLDGPFEEAVNEAIHLHIDHMERGAECSFPSDRSSKRPCSPGTGR